MEITKEQENKLGNFKEHLASVKINLRDANNELESILKARDEQSRAFESELKEHSEIMAKLNAEKEEMLDFIVTERAQLAGDIRKLESDRKEFDEYKIRTCMEIQKDKISIEQDRRNAFTEVQLMKESVKSLNEEIQTLGAQVVFLAESKQKLEEDVFNLNAKSEALYEDIDSHIEKFEELKKLASKELAVKQKELIDIETRIQEEIKKIEVPYNTLMLERQEFEKYRMDVRVLYDRANRLWCAMYPGKSLEDILKPQ